ncbi:MAG: hypothetical protein SW833_24440 [Cyanobacteriota bacterium]|nr:hypothetical protein [Cyanobacteriota bacterium]
MRLTDVVNQVRRRVSETITFIRHPDQVLLQRGRRKFQDVYEKAEFPGGKQGSGTQTPQEFEEEEVRVRPQLRQTPQNSDNNGGSHSQVVRSTQPQVSQQIERSAFPSRLPHSTETQPLEPGAKIRGGRGGEYQIVALLEENEIENRRVYQVVRVLNDKTILLKEYGLPKGNFSDREIEEYLSQFESLATLGISEEQGKKFRVLIPYDVIVDRQEKKCYLAIDPVVNSCSLRQWVNESGAITFTQTVKILDDILQTLWFLHSHRFRFGNGFQPGLAHRNLTPDSIQIAVDREQEPISPTPFSVYLADLALWEHLLARTPTTSTQFLGDQIQQDFRDLGYLCLYLLSAGKVDGDFGRAVDLLTIEDKLAVVTPFALEVFIRKLLGLEESFASAEEARQYLRNIKEEPAVPLETIFPEVEKSDKKKKGVTAFVLKILLLVIFVGLTGVLVKFLLEKFTNRSVQTVGLEGDEYECCLSEIGLGTGEQQARYATVRGSHWHDIFTERTGVFLVEPQNARDYPGGKTLRDELEKRHPELLKQYIYQCSATGEERDLCDRTTEEVFQDIEAKKIDFALLRERDNLPEQLEQQIVAYDVIVPVVAFSAYTRDMGIPQSWEGQISLEQLQDLYTGKSRRIKGKEIQEIYFSPRNYEFEIRQLFEEWLRQKSSNSEAAEEEVLSFRETYSEIIQKGRSLNTNILLERILRDFENEGIVSIGLTFLSSVFAQCSVYPLALADGDRVFQAIVQNNGRAITPKIDLCNDKGSYFPTFASSLRSGEFPFAYPLAVVYPKEGNGAEAGRKFAEMLKTDEGQYLMREMGLIPSRKLRRYE